jgi:2-oxoglutarate ferredoxin oxidoreductase subunit gamma
MRGGTAHCFVVISEKPIGSPLTRHPKVAVVFNNPSFIKYESEVAPGGLLAANSSLIISTSARTDIRLLHVPATQIADELGAARLTNVVMLGAVLTALPVVPLEAVRRALENHMLKHRPERLPLNEEALRCGAAHVSGYWKKED